MRTEPVIVVGAGIGGLTAALDLLGRGVPVLIVERAAEVGGKLREVQVSGRSFDAGPTVFTMRWVFDELFERLGCRLEDHFRLQPTQVLARHAWSADERLDLYADIAQSADAIGAFAGPAARQGYLDFTRRAQRIYQSLERPFLRGSRPTPLSLATRAGFRGLPDLLRISPFTTLWQELAQHFQDPRLRQLFGRYATYCGSSPFQAVGTLMLVAHVEQSGVWLVEGGMQRVASALGDLAIRLGARLRCNAHVDEIIVRNNRAAGVRLADGEELAARAVVFNGDVAALASGRLGRATAQCVAPSAPAGQRSLGALTWHLLGSTAGLPLSRHTVFFSRDYAAEFDALFGRGRLPDSPTVYVCAQDRSDAAAPDADGPERLMLLVNAPARGDEAAPFPSTEYERCEAATLRRLADCGLELRPESPMLMTTPTDFERLFPATGGALYGQASHGWTASFKRPGSRSPLSGLYLAGGSTHPGPGVPMAALSGSLAAFSVIEDLALHSVSSGPSLPVATPGGTSMR